MSDASDMAVSCGGEFFEWRQIAAIRRGHLNVGAGACGEYCAVWMQNVRARQEVPTNANLLDDAQWILAYSDVHGYMAAHGFRVVQNFHEDHYAAAPMAFVNKVIASGPGYYLLTVSDVPHNGPLPAQPKVHGVAFVHMKNFLFFDPNSGLAKFKTADGLRRYFPAYFRTKMLRDFPFSCWMEKYVG